MWVPTQDEARRDNPLGRRLSFARGITQSTEQIALDTNLRGKPASPA